VTEGGGAATAAAGAAALGAFDRRAQRRHKRLALLNEAARAINERGYATASLEDVAHTLGISKAAVYYYFRNKQEILYECYQMSFDIWEAALAEARRRGRTGRERVEIYIRRYLEAGLDALQPVILVREQEALEPPYRQKIEKRRRALRDQLRALIAEGIADGSLAPCNPKPAVTIIGAAISWLLRMYRADGELGREAFIDQAVRLLLDGLAGGRAAAAR
jgi:AcrR family transcriptional regulator